MLFDNLEYISITNQTTEFPKHFHETFCISLIHKGIEQIDFDNRSLFSESGSISITNPYEIHSNPLLDKNSQLAFDTLYVSNDLMKHVTKGKNIRFVNRKINSPQANQLFLDLKKAMDLRNPKAIVSYLSQFVKTLKQHSEESENEPLEMDFSNFKQINTYIENHITDSFCLEELSQMAHINKFGFIKNFKSATGLTPMNYILMKKIFSCKQMIVADSNLTELAYHYNFTDMAHFSNTFKRYIGISPKAYQTRLIDIP
ncbi:AraC family transcriptional regulator [Gelidibacter gilvus]|uniref:AraC family transcriptional regulator n=1 Tax=Gelidibacter gilvus TaxID=59602 RepID=A0A4Q0XE25_9FLAO|nr:AraC family transcriptional regulator [Gelidibacter gilvus]RXJ45778.1 AraC family transcriptional regulator [Gelidibacter gilvus]